jgi:hypothetical protein
MPCGEHESASRLLGPTSLHFDCFRYLAPSLPAHVTILLAISSRAFTLSNRTVLTVQSSACTRASSSALHRLASTRLLHLSVEQSTQPPVTLVAQHLALTSLNSLHLRHSAPTFPPVWTNALPHVATSPMHPHFSTTPFSIPPSHFPTHSTAPTYTSTQSSDNPLDLSARFYWSRRLAITCLFPHYRPFTNRDTPTLRRP